MNLEELHFSLSIANLMKTYRISALLLLTFLLIGVTGCAKKEDEASKAAQQLSKTMQQMTQNTTGGSSADKKPGVAIPAKTLAGFLPSVSGYTAKGEPETMEMEMAGAKYSSATQKFENGEKRITVSYWDYNNIAGLSMAYTAMMGMNIETNEESLHSEKFNGNPGWISWKKTSNEGTVGVVINDRVFGVIEAHGGATLDELKAVANSINYSGISGSVAK